MLLLEKSYTILCKAPVLYNFLRFWSFVIYAEEGFVPIHASYSLSQNPEKQCHEIKIPGAIQFDGLIHDVSQLKIVTLCY